MISIHVATHSMALAVRVILRIWAVVATNQAGYASKWEISREIRDFAADAALRFRALLRRC
jgi:hypothetical protein